MCATNYPYDPDYAVAPGETVREYMECLNLGLKDFAIRLETTSQTLNRIFSGKQRITPEMANKLALVTETSAAFWNNLECQYRSDLAAIKLRTSYPQYRGWLETMPVRELENRGYIPRGLSSGKLLEAILRFFGVSSVPAWEKIWNTPAVAARRSAAFANQPHLAATWIRMGEIEAQKLQCGPTNIKAFKAALPDMRRLSCGDTKTMGKALQEACVACGVALVLVPELPKLAWTGATRWLDKTAVIMLNLRWKREDIFWFSFFHEAGHVLHKHGKNTILVNEPQVKIPDDQQPLEDIANNYACSILFGKQRDRIPELTSAEEVIALAEELGITPGIVAGQYQHLTKDYHTFHELVRRVDW